MTRKVVFLILLAVALTILGEVVILKWVAPVGDRPASEQAPAEPTLAEPLDSSSNGP